MKKFFAFLLFAVGCQGVMAGEETVRLDMATTLRVELACRSDEIAFLETRAEKTSSASVYKAYVRCLPATCHALNYGGKISIYRGTGKKLRMALGSELLKSEFEGDKALALQEAQKLVDQGLCKDTSYQYTNFLWELLGSA